MTSFERSLSELKARLVATCSIVALTFDGWTSDNNLPIFAVIGHWISTDYTYEHEVFEWKELKGSHSGENMALVIYLMLQFLALERKLIAVCSDNAKNNLTLVEHLFKQLGKEFDVEHDDLLGNYKDIMWFRGKESHIRCLGHILNIVVHAILKELKAR